MLSARGHDGLAVPIDDVDSAEDLLPRLLQLRRTVPSAHRYGCTPYASAPRRPYRLALRLGGLGAHNT
jgi:hypothetical protein